MGCGQSKKPAAKNPDYISPPNPVVEQPQYANQNMMQPMPVQNGMVQGNMAQGMVVNYQAAGTYQQMGAPAMPYQQ